MRKRYIGAMMIVLLLLLGMTGCGSAEQEVFSATGRIYIHNQTADPAFGGDYCGAYTSSTSLAETYRTILSSRSVREAVQENYPGIDYTFSMEPVNDTTVYEIIVLADSAENARNIWQELVEQGENTLTKVVEGVSVKIVDYPK